MCKNATNNNIMDDENIYFYDSSDRDSVCTDVYNVIRSVTITPKRFGQNEATPPTETGGAGEGLPPGTPRAKAEPNKSDEKEEPQMKNDTVAADDSAASLSQKTCDSFNTPIGSEEAIKKNDSAENATSGGWQTKEGMLQMKIEAFGKLQSNADSEGVKLELKILSDECELLRARIKSLETELAAALAKPGGNNKEIVEKIKQQHDDLLTKARGMIFEKTKIVKNQELQIAALMSQVTSLKDVNTITKDLLEIRNAELKNLEDRLEAMDARFKAEKQRHSLVLQRAETSTNINTDLRKEYEMQLALFKELREKYDQRVQVLTSENERLKEALKAGPSG